MMSAVILNEPNLSSRLALSAAELARAIWRRNKLSVPKSTTTRNTSTIEKQRASRPNVSGLFCFATHSKKATLTPTRIPFARRVAAVFLNTA